MLVLSGSEINMVRGKVMAEDATPAEILAVFSYLDSMEYMLDDLEREGKFGTKSWREYLEALQ